MRRQITRSASVAQHRVMPAPYAPHEDPVDYILDRLALHLRASLTDVFGSMTLDEIILSFDGLHGEIKRVLSAREDWLAEMLEDDADA